MNSSSLQEQGRSFADAIVVDSIGEEYQWINEHAANMTTIQQSCCEHQGKHYDVFDMEDELGASSKVYFDISSFFGK